MRGQSKAAFSLRRPFFGPDIEDPGIVAPGRKTVRTAQEPSLKVGQPRCPRVWRRSS